MAEPKNQQTTAPYASWSSFKTFLEQLADKGLPHRIDRTVMSKMSGATQSNMRVALEFLKLTDSDSAPTDALRVLVASHGKGEAWEEALRDVVVAAYEPVIADLSLETGTAEQLWQCFRERGNVRGSTLSRAVRFFLAALREAGVRRSRYFVAPRRPRPSRGKQGVEVVPEITKAPGRKGPAGQVGEPESGADAVEKPVETRRRDDWRSHSFHLPNYEEPVEVKAPREITRDEWELINVFMAGTIKLANTMPSPSDDSEDEG